MMMLATICRRALATCSAALVLVALTAPARAFDTEARNVYIEDFASGQVLFDKDGEVRIPTASMSKMMTAYVVFEELRKGRLKLTDELPVSEHAWRGGGAKSGGSTMYLPLGGRAKVEDLLRGMIIQSGNDACITLAEGIAGSEDEFARLMNESAKRIGLKNSHFANATGLPDPDHYSTAQDLATLAGHLIRDFPEYYHYFSELEFTYNGIKQGNRNPLLYNTPGTDGVKTGHTEEAGFSLTASVKRGDRRIIMVATGLDSMKGRSQEAERLVEWAFHNFQSYHLITRGETLDQADVWLGTAPSVPLQAADDVTLVLPREDRAGVKATIDYDAPVRAPVTRGQAVGTLTVTVPNRPPVTVALVAAGDVPRLGTMGRMAAAAHYALHGSP